MFSKVRINLRNYSSLYGLKVSSNLALPDTAADTFAEVSLNCSSQPLSLTNIIASQHQWQTDGHCLLGQIPDLRQVLINPTAGIDVTPCPGVAPEHLLTLALGTGLATSLCLSPWLPLHGTAISTGRGALLFLGGSGSGKSTLALTAASAGWRVLTDDVISLHRQQAQGPLLVYPSHRRFKTEVHTAATLGFATVTESTTAPGVAKYPCYIKTDSFSHSAEPVAAIYILQKRDATIGQRCLQLPAMYGVQALSKQCYRPGLIRFLQKRQQLFRQNTLLSAQAHFYQLWLPTFTAGDGLLDYRQWLDDFLQQQTALLPE